MTEVTTTPLAPLTDAELDQARVYLHERAPAFARRIAPVYRVLGWEWADGASAYVPHAHHIEATLYELIEDLRQWSDTPWVARVETGGLFACVERERTDELRVEIGFIDTAVAFWESGQ